MKDFNYQAFHRQRKFFKWLGFGLAMLGLFIIVDMLGEIPTPLRGYKAVFAGAMLIIAGFIFLYKGFKLPIEEALNLLHDRNRGITESELVHEMLVDRATARRIIDELIRKGFLRSSSDSNASEEVFDQVR